MHMADALVTPAVAGTMYACSAAVSFPKYDLIGLLGMAVYLIAGFLLAELSFGKCLRRLRVVLPLVCMVGLNMDYSGTIQVGEYPVSKQYLPQIHAKLGYVFQDSDSQLFMSTVYEDVAFAPRNGGYNHEN